MHLQCSTSVRGPFRFSVLSSPVPSLDFQAQINTFKVNSRLFYDYRYTSRAQCGTACHPPLSGPLSASRLKFSDLKVHSELPRAYVHVVTTQCDKKVLRLIFVWRNAWRDLQSTTGKK